MAQSDDVRTSTIALVGVLGAMVLFVIFVGLEVVYYEVAARQREAKETVEPQPSVAAALETLDRNGGEIWAKLDAGTEAYYRRIARTNVPWTRILGNIRQAARARPLVIQTLWARMAGEPPPDDGTAAVAWQPLVGPAGLGLRMTF
jgi:hypothetical protein